MKDLLKNPEFAEALDMMHKGYIDSCYANAGKQPPVPESLIPLSYADAKIQKGLNVTTSGLGGKGKSPRGILVGKVVGFNAGNDASGKYVTVKPSVNYDTLNYVAVVQRVN